MAAARHVLVKCGSAEIDGYAFCVGLSALRLSYEACPDRHALVRSATYLMKGAPLRSRQILRDSLGVGRLSELVDIFHTREATHMHDKVYALLGMSFEDAGAAGLPVDYGLPWGDLLRRLIHYFLSDQVSVDTWDDKELAVIRAKGFAMGKVIYVRNDNTWEDKCSVRIAWSGLSASLHGERRESSWDLSVSAKPIKEGDVVCALRGAPALLFVRVHYDYSTIIRIVVNPPNGLIFSAPEGKWSSILGSVDFRHNFLLVWDWSQAPPAWPPVWIEIHMGDGFFSQRYAAAQNLPSSDEERQLGQCLQLLDVVQISQAGGLHEGGTDNIGWTVDACERLILNTTGWDLERLGPALLGDDGGQAALQKAVGTGCAGVVAVLLGTDKVDLTSAKWDTRPLLYRAAERGRKQIVALLLDSSKVSGTEAMLSAAARGDTRATKTLVETGKIDPNAADEWGRTPLMLAAHGGYLDVVHTLLGHPKTDRVGALAGLAKAADWNAIKLLLTAKRVELDAGDGTGTTPLMWAMQDRRTPFAEQLLDTGRVNPNARDKRGLTPLMYAALGGNSTGVLALLRTGQVNADAVDEKGWTALMFAVSRRDEGPQKDDRNKAVYYLLQDKNTNPGAKNDDGRTALMVAAMNWNLDGASVLLENPREADHGAKDNHGLTALGWAVRKGNGEEFSELLQAAISSSNEDTWSDLALHVLPSSINYPVFCFSLESGKPLDGNDASERQTPSWRLYYALWEIVLRTALFSPVRPSSTAPFLRA